MEVRIFSSSIIHLVESNLFKRLTDLDGALIQYEQNLDIPTFHLEYPSFLVTAVAECRKVGHCLSSTELGWGETPSNDIIQACRDIRTQAQKEIRKLIDHKRDVAQGTTLQEVNYWSVLCSSLKNAYREIKSFEIQLPLSILKSLGSVQFSQLDNLSYLEERLHNSEDIHGVLSAIPFNALFSCTELSKLNSEVMDVFKHLQSIISIKSYPLGRVLSLINCLNQDIVHHCRGILNKTQLMTDPYPVFHRKISDCLAIFQTMYSEQTTLWNLLHEEKRKRNVQEPLVFQESFQPLKARLEKINAVRSEHEQYLALIKAISNNSQLQLELVEKAYLILQKTVVTDTSKEASNDWLEAVKEYNLEISHVDEQQASTIKELFEEAKSKDQMIPLYERFVCFRFRPIIRGM